jgi:hydrogenase-4 component B
VVIGLGVASALLGVAFALAQNDIKRLLAYCSVENIGVILIGVGAAMLGVAHDNAAWARLALAGALLHVWNHGLFKALLFFGAGSVLHATGTREMSRLGGLWHAMPWTAGLFALGSVAICGLPPLNGFVSEWLVYLGLFDAVTGRSPAAWAGMLAIIGLGVTGAMAVASFIKACSVVFLGAARTKAAEHAHECGGWMRVPMIVLAVLSLSIGFAPVFFWPAIGCALGAWQPEWVNTEAPAPLWALTPVQGLIALLACAAAFWLWQRVKNNGQRRNLTWDCGYAAPTARMQYTGGSFAGVASGWFAWILQPELKLRRPRGPFPLEANWVARMPETVLDNAITPVGRAIMQLSAAVRRLQHGRLQSYIVYLLAGLVALAVIVVIGGKS